MLNFMETRQKVCWRNPRFNFLSIEHRQRASCNMYGAIRHRRRDAAMVGVMNRRNASSFLRTLWRVARRRIRSFCRLQGLPDPSPGCLQIDCIVASESRRVIWSRCGPRFVEFPNKFLGFFGADQALFWYIKYWWISQLASNYSNKLQWKFLIIFRANCSFTARKNVVLMSR